MFQTEMLICQGCNGLIRDEEWIVNWGSCSPCFDKHYLDYCKRNPQADLDLIVDFDP